MLVASHLTGYSAVRECTVVAAPSIPTEENAFSVSGRGWGHCIGMSQWGACGMAKQGSSCKTILRHYYTGIGFTTVTNATLRVRLRSGLQSVKQTCPNDPTTPTRHCTRGGRSSTLGPSSRLHWVRR